ncbi:MAG TPA: hypothetical protein VG125_13100 [Pirellulales bacterium]|jgi:hypothetical protein|nr:hypothetical protein [Pirellulales bacterium]
MRRTILLVVFGALLCGTSWQSTLARPAYLKQFKEKYGSDEEYGKLIDETKCFICHVGSKDKKKRNEYGVALSKVISKNEKVEKKIGEALGKVEEEKSSEGNTFGELIKDHKLPTKPQKDG